MSGRKRTRRGFLGLLGTAAAGGLAGCSLPRGAAPTGTTTGQRATGRRASSQRATDRQATRRRTTPPAGSRYTRVYREAVGSVVLVRVAGPTLGGQGSGFVFDDASRVLTNEHVVGDAERVDLRFAGGEWRAAEVLGSDVYSDLAVLAVEDRPAGAGRLPFVEAPPAIGSEVVAIGSPFGLEQSLSAGVVSGVGRSIPTAGGFAIPDAVQTDAAVNPGNSGGPLVALDGRAVGVVRSAGGDNVGFAVSAALVERVAPALVEDGRYRHPYLGVSVLDVTPTVAEANDLGAVTGVLVGAVVEGGPADGVLRASDGTRTVDGASVPVGGDVVVGLGGEPVPSAGELGRQLALSTRPGEPVELRVVRDGEETTVTVTVGARPPP